MGKTKKPEPEKIIRTLGKNLSIEVSEDEMKYRNKNSPDDVSEVNKDKLKCTVCNKSLADLLKKENEPFIHMLLNVLVCKDCSSFYGDGYFSADEDGDDKYCRWCAQGGTLYLCSTCSCAFCKKCIKQNLTRQDVKDLDSDDWQCFFCKPKPLFECRTLCWFLQENAKKKKEEKEVDSAKKNRKSEENRGSKRKASIEAEENRQSKRQKIIVETSTSKTSTPRPSTSKTSTATRASTSRTSSVRKGKSVLYKEEETSEEEKSSTPKTRSKGSKSDMESPMKPPKVDEIIISDDESDSQDTSKTSKSRTSKRDSIKTPTALLNDKQLTKSSETEKKEDFASKTRQRKTVKPADKPIKKSTEKQSKKPPEKQTKKTPEKEKKSLLENNVKKSERQRETKRTFLISKESDDESKDSNGGSQLIKLDDDNSSSEPENRRNNTKEKLKAGKLQKPKLCLSKKASKKIVQASVYVNSAITDVLELTILIGNRCEKLCTKTLQSEEDLLNTFTKLKHLMRGVHTNLDLIEKGLITKINGWKGVKEGSELPDEEGSNISVPEAETETTEKVASSPTKEKLEDDGNLTASLLQEESKQPSEQMEVDSIEDESVLKPEESVEEIKDNNKDKQDIMDVDNTTNDLTESPKEEPTSSDDVNKDSSKNEVGISGDEDSKMNEGTNKDNEDTSNEPQSDGAERGNDSILETKNVDSKEPELSNEEIDDMMDLQYTNEKCKNDDNKSVNENEEENPDNENEEKKSGIENEEKNYNENEEKIHDNENKTKNPVIENEEKNRDNENEEQNSINEITEDQSDIINSSQLGEADDSVKVQLSVNENKVNECCHSDPVSKKSAISEEDYELKDNIDIHHAENKSVDSVKDADSASVNEGLAGEQEIHASDNEKGNKEDNKKMDIQESEEEAPSEDNKPQEPEEIENNMDSTITKDVHETVDEPVVNKDTMDDEASNCKENGTTLKDTAGSFEKIAPATQPADLLEQEKEKISVREEKAQPECDLDSAKKIDSSPHVVDKPKIEESKLVASNSKTPEADLKEQEKKDPKTPETSKRVEKDDTPKKNSDYKSIPPHHSDRDRHPDYRNSGDRDHHRRPGGYDNRDRGHGSWNRGSPRGNPRGGWSHYDNRRSFRGGWTNW